MSLNFAGNLQTISRSSPADFDLSSMVEDSSDEAAQEFRVDRLIFVISKRMLEAGISVPDLDGRCSSVKLEERRPTSCDEFLRQISPFSSVYMSRAFSSNCLESSSTELNQDITSTVQSLEQEASEEWSFSLDEELLGFQEERSIEEQIVDLVLEKKKTAPLSREYPALLEVSNIINSEYNQTLQLNKGEISERKFVAMELFASSIEKHSVFVALCILSEGSSFKESYSAFLDSIQRGDENWAINYRDNPKYLAYFSLFAYLNGEISEEELVITHVLASAFDEHKSSANYVILKKGNVEGYLRKYNYPINSWAVTNFSCLSGLDNRSVIERTAVLYTTREGIDKTFYDLVKGQMNKVLGFSPVLGSRGNECGVMVLPLELSKSLYREVYLPRFPPSQEIPPTKHAGIFGYRKKVQDLIEGRPITYPSPIFSGPREVHDLGSTQIAIFVHDVLGHCALDWMNPYVNELIIVGKAVLDIGRGRKDQELITLGIELLDRVVLPETGDPAKNVALFIERLMKEKSVETCKELYLVFDRILPCEILAHLYKCQEKITSLSCQVLELKKKERNQKIAQDYQIIYTEILDRVTPLASTMTRESIAQSIIHLMEGRSAVSCIELYRICKDIFPLEISQTVKKACEDKCEDEDVIFYVPQKR